MTGENATGTEFMGSTVNTTNATSSPQASMEMSGVTELTQGNMTTGNQSSPTP
jgi:Carboxysome shell peptide mid-region.